MLPMTWPLFQMIWRIHQGRPEILRLLDGLGARKQIGQSAHRASCEACSIKLQRCHARPTPTLSGRFPAFDVGSPLSPVSRAHVTQGHHSPEENRSRRTWRYWLAERRCRRG